jgi:predicted regulator of Ras-like GTPase activity (Roadblock/LC7/MglB family)
MTPSGAVDSQLDWLLADFVRGTTGVLLGVVVASDGLRLAASERIDPGMADRLAAITSGLVSLGRSVTLTFGAGPIRQTIVEMAEGYLFITPVSQASSLAVFTSRACDMGMVGYAMTLLAERVGHALTPKPRVPAEGD